jgi:GR25 family glycosyltransferase involved in LPS biosynthesis
MKTFVISLERTPERLEEFVKSNPRHKFIQAVPAADGRLIDVAELRDTGLVEGELPYTAGAVGNALSHRELWVYAAEKGVPVTICEDDAVLHEDFEQETQRLLKLAPRDWDVVLWGWNFDSILLADTMPSLSPCYMRFDQAAMRQNKGQYLRSRIQPGLLRLYAAFGSVCYSISPGGAMRYLEYCFPLRDRILSVPEIGFHLRTGALDAIMCACYRESNSLVCFPPLAVTDNDHATSTVQTRAASEGSDSPAEGK